MSHEVGRFSRTVVGLIMCQSRDDLRDHIGMLKNQLPALLFGVLPFLPFLLLSIPHVVAMQVEGHGTYWVSFSVLVLLASPSLLLRRAIMRCDWLGDLRAHPCHRWQHLLVLMLAQIRFNLPSFVLLAAGIAWGLWRDAGAQGLLPHLRGAVIVVLFLVLQTLFTHFPDMTWRGLITKPKRLHLYHIAMRAAGENASIATIIRLSLAIVCLIGAGWCAVREPHLALRYAILGFAGASLVVATGVHSVIRWFEARNDILGSMPMSSWHRIAAIIFGPVLVQMFAILVMSVCLFISDGTVVALMILLLLCGSLGTVQLVCEIRLRGQGTFFSFLACVGWVRVAIHVT